MLYIVHLELEVRIVAYEELVFYVRVLVLFQQLQCPTHYIAILKKCFLPSYTVSSCCCVSSARTPCHIVD